MLNRSLHRSVILTHRNGKKKAAVSQLAIFLVAVTPKPRSAWRFERNPALSWWNTTPQLQRLASAFANRRGLLNCVGAVDGEYHRDDDQAASLNLPNILFHPGSHILVRRPDATSLAYRNRKGYDSIILQAVVASDMSFLDIDVGWPGAVHDQRVFENSPFATIIHSGILDRCHLTSDDGTKIPLYIVADAGYKLTSHVMTPVKRDHVLTDAEEVYNLVHSSTRMPVEIGFGFLKGMWRLTTSVHCAQVDLERRVRDVACCVGLQNFLIRHDGLIEDENLRNPTFDDWTESPDVPGAYSDEINQERLGAAVERKRAKLIRQSLFASL